MHLPSRHLRWFAIRPFYKRFAAIHDVFDRLGIGYIHPYRYNVTQAKEKDGRCEELNRIRELSLRPVLAIQMIFFCADEARIGEIRKQTYDFGRIMTDFAVNYWKPLVIPGDQLLEFLKVLSLDAPYDVIEDRPEQFEKGDIVRVVGGDQYLGLEGVICRIKHNRHLIVRIKGVSAIATSYIPQAFLVKQADPAYSAAAGCMPSMKVAELAYNIRILLALCREETASARLVDITLSVLRSARRLITKIKHIDRRLDMTLEQADRLTDEMKSLSPVSDTSNSGLPIICLRTQSLCDEITKLYIAD